MYDKFQRKIDYMRISITDRCNLRCRYCMPKDIELLPMGDLLTYEEILDVCEEAVSLGISKFKITGGEPLVRKGCISFISKLKSLSGVDQVTLTTNGILLKNQVDALKNAGIDGINISLDTLDKTKFKEITGFDQLDRVLEGIKAAVESRIPLKINAVLQKGINEEEWIGLMELARAYPLDVRFIEIMPIGEGDRGEMVSNVELLSKIKARYDKIVEDNTQHGNGPAIYYKIPGFQGSIGFISAIHGKFCGQCNRIRMTSTGEIKPCLCFDYGISVRDAVRGNDRNEIKKILSTAIDRKPEMHCFEEKEDITEQKKMVQIGG